MREVLLLIEKSSHCLSYYDALTGKRLYTLNLPEFPHEFVLNRAKTIAYIGHYGVANSKTVGEGGHSVFAVDVAQGTVHHILDTGTKNRRPHGVGMDANDRLYVLAESTSKLLIWHRPDIAGPYNLEIPTGGKKSHLFAVTRDGTKVFSVNLDSNDITVIYPFDPEAPPKKIQVGRMPEGRILSCDERRLFVTSRKSGTLSSVDTITCEVTSVIVSPGDPVRVFHDRLRGRLMTLNYLGKYIGVYDEVSLEKIAHVQLSVSPVALCFDPKHERCFLSTDCNRILIIRLDSLKIQNIFPTQNEPDVSQIILLPDAAPVLGVVAGSVANFAGEG
ncbi:YncE family protein, partial [Roseibium sp. RKSG952]|uniref:YncE family protein n=1 Tax=Roseibium sp. RKSG952 TaxID=2529384 RepID=UPI0012BB9F37